MPYKGCTRTKNGWWFSLFLSFQVVATDNPIRCAVDVYDQNSIDIRIKGLKCKKGDVLIAQFYLDNEGIILKNEDPVHAASKYCDFNKQIVIKDFFVNIANKKQKIYQLACVLGDYRGLSMRNIKSEVHLTNGSSRTQ